ncbi:Voltage-dependent calcium channel alpha-1 subunit [Cryptosporidium hominis]|uniref:Voltage-dependent calcium channel alpha-1 subunit n=1 Tax=Cryptosporidium hominis TaxID=237895 RepID=A0ABX5BE36_CRYHO|nr:Voltage-dependent calcium channel alpha-1 subunit [Cryptosporidium hominis]|eukprot:PPS94761.1 Voltage-dependent calcium channel alpha-1 subunit [Cryptosporidium hominis]
MESYYYSEINKNELLDDDRHNDETFEVGEVGDDWVPSITLNHFDIKQEYQEREGANQMKRLEELMKSKTPLTVEEIEAAMMNQDFFREQGSTKTQEELHQQNYADFEAEQNVRRNRVNSGYSHNKGQHGSSFQQKQRNTSSQHSSSKRNDDRSYSGSRGHRGSHQDILSHEQDTSKEPEAVPEIPFSSYISPLTKTHISEIISCNLSSPSNWDYSGLSNDPSRNNNLMASRDFDMILRIQLQQMAERPEIQSYSSKWNRRLLARKHNLPLGNSDSSEDKDQSKLNTKAGQEAEDRSKNKLKEGQIADQDSNRIRKFGKSTYSTVRGARELIKVHNLSKDDNSETRDEINIGENRDQIKSSINRDYSFSTGNAHYQMLSKQVFEVLHSNIFNSPEFGSQDEKKVQAPGPLVYSIIEAGNDLLQYVSYFDDEIENCPTGHLQARLRLDQELRDTIDLIFQLLFGFSKHSFGASGVEDANYKNGEHFKVSEISFAERNIACLNARRWLLNKILNIRKGRYFVLSLFHMPHISESYMTVLLESIIACNDPIIEIFRSSSIILPPLMALVPRAFRYRQGQDILAPHDGFGYSGDIDKLVDDWRNIYGGNDPYDEKYVTREDLMAKAKLGVKILETTALLANRMMQSNNYRDTSSLVPSLSALLKYYNQEYIQSLLGISTGVVFLALLYNSISVVPRQIDALKQITRLLVLAFTNYLLERDSENSPIMPIKLSPIALKDSEPVVLCVLQRSTNDLNLKNILMSSISDVVGVENNDHFISELQELIVKGTSKN